MTRFDHSRYVEISKGAYAELIEALRPEERWVQQAYLTDTGERKPGIVLFTTTNLQDVVKLIIGRKE